MDEDRSPWLEWRIQNFSCWSKSAHGVSLTCFCDDATSDHPRILVLLYPRGLHGRGERMEIAFGTTSFDPNNFFREGDLSFVGPDKSPFCTLHLGADLAVVGPHFREVVSRIEQNEAICGDHLTIKFRCQVPRERRIHVTTTLEVKETSLSITPPLPGNDGLLTIASVTYHNGEERMLVTYYTNDKSIRLEPVKKSSSTSFLYRLSVFNGSDVLEREVKGEHTRRSTFHKIPELDRGGHCILHLKEVNGLYRTDINDLFHSSSSRLDESPPVQGFSEVSLSEDLRSLYRDGEFSDFRLKCGNRTFPVHRGILCAWSPVFKEMISGDMREADIEDLDATSLELFLEFLYTGTFEKVPCGSVGKLRYAADKYRVPSLAKECVRHVCANIAVSNVCDVLRLRDEQLTPVAQDFVVDNYKDVMRSEEWKSFTLENPSTVADMLTDFITEGRVELL